MRNESIRLIGSSRKERVESSIGKHRRSAIGSVSAVSRGPSALANNVNQHKLKAL